MRNSRARFWEWFVRVASDLQEDVLGGRLREAFDRIEAGLAEHGYDFAFEMTEENGRPVLALTPEGDERRAREIDMLLDARPGAVGGWRFLGRRQPKPIEDVPVFIRHAFDVDVLDARFECRREAGKWHVSMYSGTARDLEPDASQAVVVAYLDHALGEDFVMEHVVSAELLPNEDRPSSAVSGADMVHRLTS